MTTTPAQPATSLHPPLCGGCCTRLVNVGVTLGRTVVLEGINLHVHCGELTAVVGPNGAGKTTLFRAMLGEVPHSGELLYVRAGSGAAIHTPRIGYVPQKLDLDAAAPVTVMDLFAATCCERPLWAGLHHHVADTAMQMLEVTGTRDLARRRLGELSCGQLQRVLLSLALTPMPDLLLLDEPVSGVDRAGTELFYELLSRLRRSYDLSIILVSHDLSEIATVADRLIVLNRTVLADGAPAEVLADPQVRRTFALDVVPPPAAAVTPPSFRES